MKIKSKSKSMRLLKRLAIIVLLCIDIVVASTCIVVFVADICDRLHNTDKIQRPYTEVKKYVSDLPEDFKEHPYTSNLEQIKVVKDDVKKLKAGKVRRVEYYDDDSSFIMSWDGEGISFRLTTDETLQDLVYIINQDVSFYSKDGKLLICGRENNKRHLEFYYLNTHNGVGIKTCEFDIPSIDLLGVSLNEDDEFISSSFDIRNFTLVRKGRTFLFYQYGKILQEVEFPGTEIQNKVFKDGYILDSNNDLYYLYFNADPENITMKFYKAAENIDEMVSECDIEFQNPSIVSEWLTSDNRFEIPIYKKDGKECVSFFNSFEESQWGFHNCFNRASEPVRENLAGDGVWELENCAFQYAIPYIGTVQANYYVDDYFVFDNAITIRKSNCWAQGTVHLEEFADLQGKLLVKQNRDELVEKLEAQKIK